MLKIAYHPSYRLPLPERHRFPMAKYELLPEQLLYEGTCIEDNFFEPGLPLEDYILAVHDMAYVSRLRTLDLTEKEVRKIGFPLTAELVLREDFITQGTIMNCDYALVHGVSMNIAGGTHHAYSHRGEAFCLFNDQAVAARYLQRNYDISQVLIVDLDVHQGNGTAQIFTDDDSVYTFSMHGAGNYPFRKEMSDLDIALPDGCTDEVYLGILKDTLPRLLDQVSPDFVFYLSGVDILSSDKLGRLSCSIDGCRRRDEFVFRTLHEHAIPVQVSMGGGYSPDIKTIVDAHANTYRIVQEVYF